MKGNNKEKKNEGKITIAKEEESEKGIERNSKGMVKLKEERRRQRV